MAGEPANISILAKDLTKNFNRKSIFKNISFRLSPGDSLAITGKNGSGKSTLIKIIAGVLNPSSGEIEFRIGDKKIERDNYYKYTGFVSPYLNLYDEFTGYENLLITSRIRGISPDNINSVLEKVGLYTRKNDLLRIYSSGMKQRLKLAFAILHSPQILLMDEPTGNLDTEGIKIVDEIASSQREKGILIVATNDEHERTLCKTEININALME